MAAKAKVFIVKYQSQDARNVCFVDYPSQEQNAEIITPGELVQYESQADVKVFIVEYPSQANIKIMRKNFPK